MSKLTLSVQVDDIEDVIDWYIRMKDCKVLDRGVTFVALEHPNKIVNYVEYGSDVTDTVWDLTLAQEEVTYVSDTTIEEFFEEDNE